MPISTGDIENQATNQQESMTAKLQTKDVEHKESEAKLQSRNVKLIEQEVQNEPKFDFQDQLVQKEIRIEPRL